ncbi:MAG: helix-turn-helix transcriptional regulator [Chloroflexota bacterium]|jgi:transcriptional regulator with XRE-family HTH domain
MGADGRPEPAARRCGAAIARLRTLRNLSRPQLIARLYDEIDPAGLAERISVTWLARLESGRIVKVARPTLEALCRALRCTPRERAWLLLRADRNVLAAGDEPGEAAELLTYAVDHLHRTAQETVAARLGARRVCALTDREILEITAAALQDALAQRGAREALPRLRASRASSGR